MLRSPRQVLRIVARDHGKVMRDLKYFARTTRRKCGAYAAIVVLAAGLLGTSSAHADAAPDNKQQARAAYARAMEANDRGDYATAARELALADELLPNAVTLKAALEAALDADAAVVGMELVARATPRAETQEISELARTARARFSGRVGRVKIVCPVATPCQATLDGEEIPVSTERFVLVGKHVAIVSAGGMSVRREIGVQPETLVLVNASETGSVRDSGFRLAPGWFVGTLVATVGAGVGTIISGADTKEKHEAFLASRCPEAGAAPTCTTLADDGQGAQTRTNVLAGLTGGLGLMTVIFAAVTFPRKNPAPGSVPTVSLEPRKDGAFARLVVVLP